MLADLQQIQRSESGWQQESPDKHIIISLAVVDSASSWHHERSRRKKNLKGGARGGRGKIDQGGLAPGTRTLPLRGLTTRITPHLCMILTLALAMAFVALGRTKAFPLAAAGHLPLRKGDPAFNWTIKIGKERP